MSDHSGTATRSVSSDPLSTARLLGGIDRVAAIIFLADRHQRIVAASAAAREALQKLGRSFDTLAGVELSTVHGDPPGFRAALEDGSKLPYEHKIKTEQASFKAIVSAVTDENGQLAGYAVGWEDQTKRNRVEVELGRVLSMIESCPTNIICGDPDLTMQYLNPAGRKSLESLAHVLPVDAGQVSGRSMTVFFEHPDEAARVLADPARMPWRTRCAFGAEIVDFTVSATFDHQQR